MNNWSGGPYQQVVSGTKMEKPVFFFFSFPHFLSPPSPHILTVPFAGVTMLDNQWYDGIEVSEAPNSVSDRILSHSVILVSKVRLRIHARQRGRSNRLVYWR